MESRCANSAPINSAAISQEVVEERKRLFPIGASLSLAKLEEYEAGIRLQALLLEQEPVTWFPEVQAWLVTGRQLVEEVLVSADRFTVYAEARFVRTVLG
ncbi:MAG: hypothetical protein WCJ42_11705, partial [Actinomycetes bacterium]